MVCNNCKDNLVQYVDNDLDIEQKIEVENHVSTCETCQNELIQLKELTDIFGRTGTAKPNIDMNTVFLKNLEIEKKALSKPNFMEITNHLTSKYMRIAAGIALLIIGFGSGYIVANKSKESTDKLVALQLEVSIMKEQVAMSMLSQESASERIMAVNNIKKMSDPSADLIKILIKTLNYDTSPNVRIAAAKGLARYPNSNLVRLNLTNSLENQTDPIVQVILINILSEMEEKRAIKKFKYLLENEYINDVVKKQAEIGLQILI